MILTTNVNMSFKHFIKMSLENHYVMFSFKMNIFLLFFVLNYFLSHLNNVNIITETSPEQSE